MLQKTAVIIRTIETGARTRARKREIYYTVLLGNARCTDENKRERKRAIRGVNNRVGTPLDIRSVARDVRADFQSIFVIFHFPPAIRKSR